MTRILIIVTVCVLAVYFVFTFAVPPLMRHMYPMEFKQEIRQAVAGTNLDPFLIAAIINVESGYEASASSPKGAVGLMQLMPETARWIGERHGVFFELEELRQPKLNIQLGVWYILYLQERFDTLPLVLAAYNAGQGNVRQWLNDEVWDGSREEIDQIPFGETRSYVHRTLFVWDLYRQLYENQWYN